MLVTSPSPKGEARYSDHDLEPLRAALLALSKGSFTRKSHTGAETAAHGSGSVLGQIWLLSDAVATELSTLNDEVARRTEQVRDIAMVTTAVARGDLTRKVTVDAQGEMMQLKQTVNTMVDQLSAFAGEVTRVAREVGTEGRLGGQADVKGVSGIWKRLTESVNGLASNLTTQVRAIAGVASAVAEGDLTQSITVEARGEVAELEDKAAKQIEFARTIHEAGSDLFQLINDILDLSKVEAGKMEVHPAPIALQALLDYVEATFRPTATQKGLSFEVEADPGLPALVYSDEQRLQQILRNLLSNAVKFTATGGVRLRVAAADRSIRFSRPLRQEGSVIAFRVTDTGVGISEDKLDLIFGAFQQADGTTSRGYGGTGLGLSISRDIARLLGGEIHAVSRLGHGSTFTFYLPGRQPGDPAAGADSAASRASAGQAAGPDSDGPGGTLAGTPRADDPLNGAKLLIIDDDVRNVFAMTSVFERYGAQVRYAENGRQGMEILDHEDDIALVLMDIMMPELDGYATTAAIRLRPEFADLPIITVTAKAMKGDRPKSIASGASEYVTKPVDISHLIDLMRGWLERRTRPRPEGRLPAHPRTEGSG